MVTLPGSPAEWTGSAWTLCCLDTSHITPLLAYRLRLWENCTKPNMYLRCLRCWITFGHELYVTKVQCHIIYRIERGEEWKPRLRTDIHFVSNNISLESSCNLSDKYCKNHSFGNGTVWYFIRYHDEFLIWLGGDWWWQGGSEDEAKILIILYPNESNWIELNAWYWFTYIVRQQTKIVLVSGLGPPYLRLRSINSQLARPVRSAGLQGSEQRQGWTEWI